MSTPTSPPLSDDEVFIGGMTLKEARRRIFLPSGSFFNCTEDPDESLKLIEVRSEPNLISDTLNTQISLVDSSPESYHDNRTESSIEHKNEKSSPLKTCPPKIVIETTMRRETLAPDDSFLLLEQATSDLQLNDNEDLDNTLEVVNYILNHEPRSIHMMKDDNPEIDSKPTQLSLHPADVYNSHNIPEEIQNPLNTEDSFKHTDIKNYNHQSQVLDSPTALLFSTPLKENIKQEDIFATPAESKVKPNNTKIPFKTPMSVPYKSNVGSAKKTPMKSNAYQHITSPVASYIKKTPQAPLIRNVKPMKPLPGSSAIPKLVKSVSQSSLRSNKENVNLPTLAYKSAKETKVINASESGDQVHWNKLMSSLPRPKPLVVKHDHRENTTNKKTILNKLQEDSFADLSLHQADVSVCTQKSAFSNRH